jgi:hypothetical protein
MECSIHIFKINMEHTILILFFCVCYSIKYQHTDSKAVFILGIIFIPVLW